MFKLFDILFPGVLFSMPSVKNCNVKSHEKKVTQFTGCAQTVDRWRIFKLEVVRGNFILIPVRQLQTTSGPPGGVAQIPLCSRLPFGRLPPTVAHQERKDESLDWSRSQGEICNRLANGPLCSEGGQGGVAGGRPMGELNSVVKLLRIS